MKRSVDGATEDDFNESGIVSDLVSAFCTMDLNLCEHAPDSVNKIEDRETSSCSYHSKKRKLRGLSKFELNEGSLFTLSLDLVPFLLATEPVFLDVIGLCLEFVLDDHTVYTSKYMSHFDVYVVSQNSDEMVASSVLILPSFAHYFGFDTVEHDMHSEILNNIGKLETPYDTYTYLFTVYTEGSLDKRSNNITKSFTIRQPAVGYSKAIFDLSNFEGESGCNGVLVVEHIANKYNDKTNAMDFLKKMIEKNISTRTTIQPDNVLNYSNFSIIFPSTGINHTTLNANIRRKYMLGTECEYQTNISVSLISNDTYFQANIVKCVCYTTMNMLFDWIISFTKTEQSVHHTHTANCTTYRSFILQRYCRELLYHAQYNTNLS